MTNAEHIRTMSNEDLAEWLETVNMCTCAYAMQKKPPCDMKLCPCWLDWLKEEVK